MKFNEIVTKKTFIMSLVKSNHRNLPRFGESFMRDPFFSDLFEPRRSMFQMNKFFNEDMDLPPINIKDQGNSLELELAAPGLNKDDFKITLDNGILTISSEKEQNREEEEDGFLRKEFSYNSFTRSFSLPENIDEDKEVKATYNDGILKLSIDKKPEQKSIPPKSIKVS